MRLDLGEALLELRPLRPPAPHHGPAPYAFHDQLRRDLGGEWMVQIAPPFPPDRRALRPAAVVTGRRRSAPTGGPEAFGPQASPYGEQARRAGALSAPGIINRSAPQQHRELHTPPDPWAQVGGCRRQRR